MHGITASTEATPYSIDNKQQHTTLITSLQYTFTHQRLQAEASLALSNAGARRTFRRGTDLDGIDTSWQSSCKLLE